MSGIREELLLAEFSEAWSHYRHIESTRQQYLTLFFGFLAGVSGLLATLASRVDFSSILSLAGLAGLCWTLSVFTGLLFANTRKMGRVLSGYGNTMRAIREIAYGEDYDALVAALSVHSSSDPIMKMKVYRLQLVSEVVFASAALTFSAALLFLAFRSWNVAGGAWRAAFVLGSVSASGFIIYVLLAPTVLAWRTSKVTREKPRDVGSDK